MGVPEQLLIALGDTKGVSQAAAAESVKWEWWTGWRGRDPRPYHAQLSQARMPKRLKSEPKDRDKACFCGLDSQGRLRWRRTFSSIGKDEIFHDTFVHYEDDRAHILRFRCPGVDMPQRLASVVTLTYKNGRVASALELTDGPSPAKRNYRYGKDGLLDRVTTYYGKSHQDTFLVEHDELGKLVEIRRRKGGDMLFKRAAKGVTLRAALRRVEALLLERIPAALAAASVPDEPVYCLALVYCVEGEGPLPPKLGLGTVSERARLEKEPHADRAVWDPIEWEYYEGQPIRVETPQLAKASLTANQLVLQADDEMSSRKMLWSVVRKLALDPLPFEVTDDFAVLAVHEAHEDLKTDLRKLRRR